MVDSIFIDGIGISNYRSFAEVQYIGPCQKVNIIIGKNNSGKSNVLYYIKDHLRNAAINLNQLKRYSFAEMNIPTVNPQPITTLAFGLQNNSCNYKNLLKKHKDKLGEYSPVAKEILQLLTNNEGMIWFDYIADEDKTILYKGTAKEKALNSMIAGATIEKLVQGRSPVPASAWQVVWSRLTNNSGGDLLQHWVPDILNVLSPIRNIDIPNIYTIPATRYIRMTGRSADDPESLDGNNLILILQELQSPPYNKRADRKRFDEINKFLQDILENSTAKLDIPHDKSAILVEIEGKLLPLSSLGTGITQVIIMAAAATAIQNSIVCIEEPELHLHAILQKKLIEYLQKHTDNQYFITTHSAHIMNAENTAIFHVKLEDGHSVITAAVDNNHKFSICSDLGYHASDLLQANSIIWVEGPSDRIYLNYWIHSLATDFVEGLHYSIMFYGGKLLSHLSGNDDEVAEFISLKRLNRNMAILIDSDKKKLDDHINATKERIRIEFSDNNGLAWITQGKEIENYISITALESAINTVHGATNSIPDDPYTNVFANITTPNKVRVAQAAVAAAPTLEILDLSQQLNNLITFIRNANT